MPVEEINGVLVNFPFTPYGCQVDYMSKVLSCLQKNQNGVLESPTGTGKTLSLLCSSLAWLEGRKAQVEYNKSVGLTEAGANTQQASQAALKALAGSLNASAGSAWGSDEFLVPRIIYASRTHSQLTQAVQELKKTAYKSVKTSVFGSREQLCIHPHVQKITTNAGKVQMCRQLVKSRRCHFYNNVEDFKNKGEPRKVAGNVIDIEDLVQMGQKAKACPYYMSRELKTDADIVFMPYNYLLDTVSRKVHGVDLQGSVIIFDEAHNLEKICEESASFDLGSLDLATAIEETTKLGEMLADSAAEPEMSQVEDSPSVPEFDLGDVIRLKKTLMEVEAKIDAVEIPSKDGNTLEGAFVFELLRGVNITWSNKNYVMDVVDKMTNYLSNDESNAILNTKGAGLSKFASCLKIIFCQEPRDMMSVATHENLLAKQFKVHIRDKDDFKKGKSVDSWSTNEKKNERTLSYWCFSPGHTMKDLVSHGVKVIILTSGTLSPLDSFAKEMEIPFPVQLENPHVIEQSQVWLGTVCKGPDSVVLSSDFKNRNSGEYQSSLGNAIINFARIVPNGLLVFFPSYPLMEKCIETWQQGNQWTRMNQYKAVVVEPKGKIAFTDAMNEFYEKINDRTLNGAIFMAVCRGKVSEGLDFADMNGRAVLITGLPYPPIFDPKIKLKMQFMDQNKLEKKLDGWSWYRLQASRAVNQAIGRVIRHKQDYGAIILLDNRFTTRQSQAALPLWVRGQSKMYEQFGVALREVIKFFREAQALFPMSACKSHQRPKGESNIASGAFFEPTLTRKSQGQSQMSIEYESASNVACHVPGMKEESIFAQYSKKEIKHDGVSRKRSLLEALESTDIPESTQSNGSQGFPSSWITSFQPPKKKASSSKQKKIIVKPNSQASSSEIDKSTNKVDLSSVKSSVLESCKNYVGEVKSVLSKDKYLQFSSSLAQYRQDHKIADVVPVLANLFTESEEKHPLFQKFYRFVRKDDRPYYRQVCLDLTGLHCDNNNNNATTPAGENASIQKDGGLSGSATKCILCGKDPAQSGMRHECQAIACFQCWKGVFEKDDVTCPSCALKVKRKALSVVDGQTKS